MFEVSVIIPVFNSEKYVKKAVESALNQPETGEIIIVEDGSTDSSLKICRRLAYIDPRVKIVSHPDGKNHGAGASRNLGILEANCEFLSFLDADDFMLSGRFITASKILNEVSGVDGVYDAVGTFFNNEESNTLWRNQRGSGTITTIRKRIPPQHLFDSLLIPEHGVFHTNGITVKRLLFNKTGLFDEDLLLHQDTAMWIKMAYWGWLEPGEIKNPVAMRRVHSKNRITKIPSGDFSSKELLDRKLMNWAIKTGLPKSKRRTLEYYLWRNKFYIYNSWRILKIKISNNRIDIQLIKKAHFLLKRFFNNPEIFFTKYFIWLCRDLINETFSGRIHNDTIEGK